VLKFPPAFRLGYFVYRYFGVQRFLADRLADRVELLTVTRLLVERLEGFNHKRLRSVFGKRITAITGKIIARRREAVGGAFDALRRQYPDYVAALEARFLRQSAVRHEIGRYPALFEEGLIPQELYDDLKPSVAAARAAEPRPRFDIGLDTHRLIRRLDILSALDDVQLDRVAKLLRPRFTVPERARHSPGKPRRRGLLYRLRRGRGRAAEPARSPRQRRFFRRDGAVDRTQAAGRRGGSHLLPAARAAKGRFRTVCRGKPGGGQGHQ
jgi:hypothetical protein